MKKTAVDPIIDNYYNTKLLFLHILLFFVSLFVNNYVPEFSEFRSYDPFYKNLFVGSAVLIYILAFSFIQLSRHRNKSAKFLLNVTYWHFFLMYFSTAVIVPILSENYISSDWWAVIIACAILQSLPELRTFLKILIYTSPFISFLLYIIKDFYISGNIKIDFVNAVFVIYITFGLILMKYVCFAKNNEPHEKIESSSELSNFSKKYALTAREVEVFSYLISNLSQKEIAGKLFVSPETVKKHIQSIYLKTRVSKRIELYIKFMEERSE